MLTYEICRRNSRCVVTSIFFHANKEHSRIGRTLETTRNTLLIPSLSWSTLNFLSFIVNFEIKKFLRKPILMINYSYSRIQKCQLKQHCHLYFIFNNICHKAVFSMRKKYVDRFYLPHRRNFVKD